MLVFVLSTLFCFVWNLTSSRFHTAIFGISENESNSMDTTLADSVQPEDDTLNGKESGKDITRSNSNNSVSLSNSDGEQGHFQEKNEGSTAKKIRKRGPKKKNKPEELLQCTVCGRQGLTSEFCASGRFCSQRCVGAHASKCRADTLAAAAAAGESVEHRKRKRQRKEVGKKSTSKKKSFSLEKVSLFVVWLQFVFRFEIVPYI